MLKKNVAGLLCLLLLGLSCDAADHRGSDNAADKDRGAAPSCWELPGDNALSTALTPQQAPEYYVAQSLKYFDTLDSYVDPRIFPEYSALVARWEWPPWLKLTGLGREAMIAIDILLKLYPTTIPERDCRAFDVQPFGRCHVVFYYQDEPCSIYEEFTFNDRGEMTFIEAWSDIPGLLPTNDPDDYWAEGPDVNRLSTKLPGLGNAEGLIDLNGACLRRAARQDADVADFAARADYPALAWLMELALAGDDMMRVGCR